MTWRRGLLLAGINVAVAIPLIVSLESKDAGSLRIREKETAQAELEVTTRPSGPATLGPTGPTESSAEQSVSFNSCSMWVHYPVQAVVEQAATYPSLVFTGWRMACPPKWSFASKMHADVEWVPTLASEAALNVALRRVDRIFLVVLLVQWLLVGSFPLVHPRKWWAEPGALITLCNVVAAGLALFSATEGLAQLPALVAMITWILWFGLLLWKPAHHAWQSTLGGLRRLSN